MQDEEQDYWSHRIDYLKNEHQIINKIVETEYQKTIEKTRQLFNIPKVTEGKINRIKKCSTWRDKVNDSILFKFYLFTIYTYSVIRKY